MGSVMPKFEVQQQAKRTVAAKATTKNTRVNLKRSASEMSDHEEESEDDEENREQASLKKQKRFFPLCSCVFSVVSLLFLKCFLFLNCLWCDCTCACNPLSWNRKKKEMKKFLRKSRNVVDERKVCLTFPLSDHTPVVGFCRHLLCDGGTGRYVRYFHACALLLCRECFVLCRYHLSRQHPPLTSLPRFVVCVSMGWCSMVSWWTHTDANSGTSRQRAQGPREKGWAAPGGGRAPSPILQWKQHPKDVCIQKAGQRSKMKRTMFFFL